MPKDGYRHTVLRPHVPAQRIVVELINRVNKFLKGTCVIKNGKHACECKPTWTGVDCKTATCDNYNKCGQHGIIFL